MHFGAADPGLTGGWVILDNEGIPITTSPFTGWKKFSDLIRSYEGNIDMLFALEAVSAMPKQGVSSTFTFGKNAGGYDALLAAFDIPHIMVRPQKWQKSILGTFPKGQSKVRALAYAQRRWPSLELKKKDSGVVDALCLATYARQEHLGIRA